MRKMISDGQGNRVHFSMPDHEWRWFVESCRLSGRDPVDILKGWASSGLSSSDLRDMARNRISGAVRVGVELAASGLPASAYGFLAQRRPS